MRLGIAVAAIITALVACFIFMPALHNQFLIWDDTVIITENPNITSMSPEFFRWAFFSQYGLFWMPLTWISIAFDHSIWGLNPYGFHLTNLILHGINTFLVAVLAARLVILAVNDAENSSDMLLLPVVALAAGLLFGLHPLRVEAVAWVAERKGLLNALFTLAALHAYTTYAGTRSAVSSSFVDKMRNFWYLATLMLFTISLLCKAMSVTLPIIFLLLDWGVFKRLAKRPLNMGIFIEKLPFLVVSTVVSAITISLKPVSDIAFSEISRWSRLHVACKALMSYLGLMLWPADLSPLYDHPGNSVAIFSFRFWLPILLMGIITALCLLMAVRKQRIWLAVWLIFVVGLLPVLGFTQTGGQSMADRFTYLPAIALTLLATAGIFCLCRRLFWRFGIRIASTVMLLILTAISFPLAMVTSSLLPVWHDTESLWSRAIAVRPGEAGRAYYQRGLYYLEQGNFAKSLADANEALKILSGIGYTRIAKVYSLRGRAYAGLHMENEAARDFATAQRLPSPWRPPDAEK